MSLAQPNHEDEGHGNDEQKMSLAEFERVSAMVFKLAGIVLKEHKQQMVNARLTRRIRALSLSSFAEYIDLLEGPKAGEELESFINAVTTNLTSFFREDHHFEHLSSKVLRPLADAGANRIRIWSAGCSTGEEPYSIAMTVLGAPTAGMNWDLKILATDLDTNVLNHAKAGVYNADRGEAIPAEYGSFTKKTADGFEMSEKARNLITFRQLNLLEKWPVSGPFDAIFCRNVMIYFDAETKADLVTRFASLLAPHGTLYIGHSEALLGTHPLLVRDGQTTYKRNA